MKRWSWGGLVFLLIAVCGGALAGFGNPAPVQEVARESLDLLKAMGPSSPAARNYVGACVTAIAHAKRLEDRNEAPSSTVRVTWLQAAGRCRGMANTVCDAAPLET